MKNTAGGALYPEAINLEKVKDAHRPLYAERTMLPADGNAAAAYALLQMWRAVLFAGFPITPSTKWLETVAAVTASKKTGLKRLKLMESEHAVADYLAGAASSCRDLIVSTATSSVGLDHMTESIRSLGASGLGNVILVNVFRATANYPLCIEGDPSDTLAHRDDGFIQIVCRGVQQIYDTLIQAPCLGMHPEILTPVMPGYYGIKDSHRSSRLMLEPDEKIHRFQDACIKPCPLPGLINGDTAMGNCVTSKYFQGYKINQRRRLDPVFKILQDIAKKFQTDFGRPGITPVEKVFWPEDGEVDVAIIGMGPDIGTAAALAKTRTKQKKEKWGVLAVRLLTPFPREEYARLLSKAGAVLVMNQAGHHGCGHLTLDIAEACYSLDPKPVIVSGFAGLGGADVSEESWELMMDRAQTAIGKKEKNPPPIWVHEGRILWPD